jgi:hypothetical protein
MKVFRRVSASKNDDSVEVPSNITPGLDCLGIYLYMKTMKTKVSVFAG